MINVFRNKYVDTGSTTNRWVLSAIAHLILVGSSASAGTQNGEATKRQSRRFCLSPDSPESDCPRSQPPTPTNKYVEVNADNGTL